ncbi:hypothetical protein D3C76_857740 [compost metagenome]
MEGLVAQDPGIVDQHIDPAKGIQCLLDNTRPVGHRIMVGQRRATRFTNLRHHPVGRRGAGAFAMGRAAQIIDHHPRTVAGKQQGMRSAQAAASSGDNHHFIVQAHRIAHAQHSREISRNARVSASTGQRTIKRAQGEWQAIRPEDDAAGLAPQDQATFCATGSRACWRKAR